jgi:hypothetical protein
MIIENKKYMDMDNKKINKKYIGLGCYISEMKIKKICNIGCYICWG